jgi:hypothetical protein
MTKFSFRADPDPTQLPEASLWCAIAACGQSVHRSDRDFAQECEQELRRRLDMPRAGQMEAA